MRPATTLTLGLLLLAILLGFPLLEFALLVRLAEVHGWWVPSTELPFDFDTDPDFIGGPYV